MAMLFNEKFDISNNSIELQERMSFIFTEIFSFSFPSIISLQSDECPFAFHVKQICSKQLFYHLKMSIFPFSLTSIFAIYRILGSFCRICFACFVFSYTTL